jgi:hypothetical protein
MISHYNRIRYEATLACRVQKLQEQLLSIPEQILVKPKLREEIFDTAYHNELAYQNKLKSPAKVKQLELTQSHL